MGLTGSESPDDSTTRTPMSLYCPVSQEFF